MNTMSSSGPLWTGSATFEQGDSGPAVRQLQRAMNRSGLSVEVDGTFDWRMERKVRAFQRRRGLNETGRVGSAMKNVLDRAERQEQRKQKKRVEQQEEVKFRRQVAGGSLLAAAGVGGLFWYLNQL